MKNVVILSGAGLSSESGLLTFRDCKNGLWNDFDINDVCTYSGWEKNPQKVQDFYNQRRRDVYAAKPNKAHNDIAEFQKFFSEHFNIVNVTQNVDDLLERAGCQNVIHVHGDITKAYSSNPVYNWMGLSNDVSNNPPLYDVDNNGLTLEVMKDGYPLRPFVVWFGEQPHHYDKIADLVEESDYLVIVGTSLNVYPVASFPNMVKESCQILYVDPTESEFRFNGKHIKEIASIGMEIAIDEIIYDSLGI